MNLQLLNFTNVNLNNPNYSNAHLYFSSIKLMINYQVHNHYHYYFIQKFLVNLNIINLNHNGRHYIWVDLIIL